MAYDRTRGAIVWATGFRYDFDLGEAADFRQHWRTRSPNGVLQPFRVFIFLG